MLKPIRISHLYRVVIAFILVHVSFLVSCTTVSTEKRPEGVVVERNKQIRPAWADSPSERLMVNSTETRFHFALLKERDLPLAIKKSQTNAISSSFGLWLPGFNTRLEDFPQIKGIRTLPKTQKDMEILLSQVAHKIHAEVSQVEDIYYERIRIDNYEAVPELQGVTEYFDVHTLVQLLPVEGEKLQNALGQALSASKHAEMRRVGKDLLPKKMNKQKK